MKKEHGEIIVSIGKDSVEIQLSGRPKRAHAKFKDEEKHIPCSPHHHDKLEHTIIKKGIFFQGYYLLISWEVYDTRVIEWEVY
jgi:hypothetical protein